MKTTPNGSTSERSHFDERAKTWDDNPVQRERNAAIAAALIRRVPLQSSMKVLDYGAGTGLLALALIEQVGSILAVDTSEGMLEVLRGKIREAGHGNTIHPLSLDLAANELPDSGPLAAPFDLVYSSMTLHHVRDVRALLERFAKLLSVGGQLAIADLEAEDGSFHSHGVEFFHKGFDPRRLADTLSGLGFFDIETERIYEIKRELEGTEISFGVFLLTARKG